MSPAAFQVRRATVDDLPRLRQLWALMRLPVEELDRQLTDFQVITDAAGTVIGAAALEIHARQARIHSETFEDFSLADAGRQALWHRLQNLAVNHGLFRLWTQEQSPFWSQQGFRPPPAEDLEKMPSQWDRAHKDWLTLKLKDEETAASLEKEFALFVESEKAQRSQLLARARMIKGIVISGISLIALLFLAAAIWLILKQRAGSLPPP
ncbi:MAG TPA: hypothetical protein PKN95_06705 [Verrucomicrobiota bacterium]|nr:hypothetical protein [Verrucomicrobiota bacterium]HNT14729.1 hypothetical protein [Verrucomicrobiota bacterium]